MTTLNEQEARGPVGAKEQWHEPRSLRFLMYFNSALSVVAFGVLLIGSETGQSVMALVGLALIGIGLPGWFAVLVWIVVLLVRDTRAMLSEHGFPTRGLFKRGRNHEVNAETD